jgi:hypothetical protein
MALQPPHSANRHYAGSRSAGVDRLLFTLANVCQTPPRYLPTTSIYQIPPPLIPDDTQFAEQDYEQIQSNVTMTIEFRPYIQGWPQFFYSGRGAVTLQGYDFFSGDYLNGIASSTTYTKPPALTQASIIIEAIPTPETSSIGLLLIGLGLIAAPRWRPDG